MKTEIKKITIEELEEEASRVYLHFLDKTELTEEQAAMIAAVYGESIEDRLSQEVINCKDYDRPYDKYTLEEIIRTDKLSAIEGLLRYWNKPICSDDIEWMLSWRYLCKDFVEIYKKGLYEYPLVKVSGSIWDGYYVLQDFRDCAEDVEDDEDYYKGVLLFRVNYEYRMRNIRAIRGEKWKESYDEIVELL